MESARPDWSRSDDGDRHHVGGQNPRKRSSAHQPDVHPTESTTTNANRKRQRLLNRDERKDIADALEHIVATGNHHRHLNWRLQEHRERTQDIPSLGERNNGNDDDSCQNGQSTDFPDKKDAFFSRNEMAESFRHDSKGSMLTSAEVHAEDLRLYGRHGALPRCWPVQNESARYAGLSDQNWDLEYGDDVDIVAFTQQERNSFHYRRLPTEPPLPFDIHKRVHSRTQAQVLQQCPAHWVIHCWDRAVGVANAITAHEDVHGQDGSAVADATDANSSETPSETSRRLYKQMELPELHFGADPSCPVCHATFDTTLQCEAHFYGRNHVRGCVWTLLERRQHKIYHQCLIKEVYAQARALIRCVLTSAWERDKEAGSNKSSTYGRYNWQDVLHITKVAVQHARLDTVLATSDNQANVAPWLETLQLEPGGYPVVLNPCVLQCVERNLILRYAKVPR